MVEIIFAPTVYIGKYIDRKRNICMYSRRDIIYIYKYNLYG